MPKPFAVDDLVTLMEKARRPSRKLSPDRALALDTQKSVAGEAFRNIARRVTGEKVPLMRLDQRGGVLRRLARIFGGSGEDSL